MAAFETKFPGVIVQQTPRYRTALATHGAFPPAAPAVSVAPVRPSVSSFSVAPIRPPAPAVSVAPIRPPAPAGDVVTVLTDAEMRTLEAFARGCR